jgi:hypothetical protein
MRGNSRFNSPDSRERTENRDVRRRREMDSSNYNGSVGDDN